MYYTVNSKYILTIDGLCRKHIMTHIADYDCDKWQREGAPHRQNRSCPTVSKIWSWAPDEARHQDGLIDWLTVGGNVTLTWPYCLRPWRSRQLYVRSVGNIAHIHMMQRIKGRININMVNYVLRLNISELCLMLCSLQLFSFLTLIASKHDLKIWFSKDTKTEALVFCAARVGVVNKKKTWFRVCSF
jgi:hypothetical protein